MNVGTQTPRKFYKKELDSVLHCFTMKLEGLEKEYQLLNPNPKKTRQRIPKTQPRAKPMNTKSLSGNATRGNIRIGPNGTTLPRKVYAQIDWTCVKKAIRDLCYLIFGQQTLGTHTLTGRMGPGSVMYNRKTKAQLKPQKVQDILSHIMHKFDVNEVQVLDGIRRACRNSARALSKGRGELQRQNTP